MAGFGLAVTMSGNVVKNISAFLCVSVVMLSVNMCDKMKLTDRLSGWISLSSR
jgi:hypothetical protein